MQKQTRGGKTVVVVTRAGSDVNLTFKCASPKQANAFKEVVLQQITRGRIDVRFTQQPKLVERGPVQ